MRSHSVPGGHTVYTVSASTSRRQSVAGLQLAEEDIIAVAVPSTETSAVNVADADSTSARDAVVREDDQPGSLTQSAAAKLLNSSHHPSCQPDGDEDDPLFSNAAGVDDVTHLSEHDSYHTSEEGPGTVGHVQSLMRRMAAGDVPEELAEEDLQLLLMAIEQTQGATEPEDSMQGREQAAAAPVDDAGKSSPVAATHSQTEEADTPDKNAATAALNSAGSSETLAEEVSCSSIGPGAVTVNISTHSIHGDSGSRLSSQQATQLNIPGAPAGQAREQAIEKLRRRGSSRHVAGTPAPAAAAHAEPPVEGRQHGRHRMEQESHHQQEPQPAEFQPALQPVGKNHHAQQAAVIDVASMSPTTNTASTPSAGEHDLDRLHELRASQQLPAGRVQLLGTVSQSSRLAAPAAGPLQAPVGRYAAANPGSGPGHVIRLASEPGDARASSVKQAHVDVRPSTSYTISTTPQASKDQQRQQPQHVRQQATEALAWVGGPVVQAAGAHSTYVPVQPPSPLDASQSLTSEKLSSILAFLDNVDQETDVSAAVGTATPATAKLSLTGRPREAQRPGNSAMTSQPVSTTLRTQEVPPSADSMLATCSVSPFTSFRQAQASHPSASLAHQRALDQGYRISQPATDSTDAKPLRHSVGSPQPQGGHDAARARRATAGDLLLQRVGILDPSVPPGSPLDPAPQAPSHTTRRLTTGGPDLPGPRPAHLAETVYDGVRAKIRRLQEDVRDRDNTIAVLHKVLGQARCT
jgi:hypothetical protein